MASLTSAVSRASTAASSAASASSTGHRAAPQGGILEGMNPIVYDSKNPIILFIVQAGIIIIFCRLLHYPLSKLRQPRVIAEVIGGILLGPSVMMRIPGFKDAIFPAASMPGLSLVANIGLILFLFVVGLEVNMRLFKANWQVALSVGLAGMLLPFGLGSAIAYGLYHEFRNDPGTVPITFPVFMLFIGTALAITAFPVLCRILTELKLLNSPVGVTVLAAGVGNDVTGWILLALCVALVNNGSGIAALYVLLTAVAWILFLVYAVRPVFLILLKRSGSLQNGPTQGMMTLTILMVLISSWFTGIIGVHPIFGAFLVGVICPHDGGFAIKVTEKIEDLVAVVFLPLYFAQSGLSTNLGLLNDGITWAYVIGVLAVAFMGKIIGGTLAARANKLLWRESFTIGALMSCKGLVELIVLNIGLQAKILSTRTFTIFVVMALVTTVATTPMTLALYPPWYQKKIEAWKRGEIDWDGNSLLTDKDGERTPDRIEQLSGAPVRRLLVYLKLDSLSGLFTFISLLGGERLSVSTKVHKDKAEVSPESEATSSDEPKVAPKRPFEVHGIRMLELSERTSSVMQSSEIDQYAYRDPVVNAFRTFAQLNNVAVSGSVSVVPEGSYAETLTNTADDHFSDLVLIPWSETVSEVDSAPDSLTSGLQDSFIQRIVNTAVPNTAIFVNQGFGGGQILESKTLSRTLSGVSLRNRFSREPALQPIADRSHHIYFPFFGGADDRVALRFVLQLAQNSNITVTIVHFSTSTQADSKTPIEPVTNSSLVITERVDTETLHASAASDASLLHSLRDSLPEALSSRVVFADQPTTSPIADCLSRARSEIGQSPRNAGDLIVVGRGRHNLLTGSSEITSNSDMRKTLGPVAESIVSGGVRGSVLVFSAGTRDMSESRPTSTPLFTTLSDTQEANDSLRDVRLDDEPASKLVDEQITRTQTQTPSPSPPPPRYPNSEPSTSAPPSPRPPPFSSLYRSTAEVVEAYKTVTEAGASGSVPAYYAPTALESHPASSTSSQDVLAETKAALPPDTKGESSKKDDDNSNNNEPPPAYSEGSSPLDSFTYLMAAAGGAASIITQVQQGGAPPINTLGDVGADENITMDLRGQRFTLSRDELLTLPEFVLLSLFPNGLLPDGHLNSYHEGDAFQVDYDPASLQYMLEFFRNVAQTIPDAGSQGAEADAVPIEPMAGSAREMLQDRAGIIVLREDLDFYVIPHKADIEQPEMIEVKRAAGKALLKQDGIFSGLRRSEETGTTEQHLIEMLTAGGFNHDDHWGHRANEPNKAVICSLALARLRTDIRGDMGNNAVGMAQKLLLFWRKPARRCWWEGVELEGVEGVEGKLKVWIRRVWTLEMSVIGLR